MTTIDADAHVIESEQTWGYISDEKLKPFLITRGGGRPQHWLIDGRVFNRGVNVNRELPEAICEMRDIEGRLKHMDELEIDIQVLYPSLFLRPLTGKPEVEVAICRSYNRWLTDICSKGRGRLHWIAVVPVIDIASAITEVQFAKANGACGIFMRGLIDDKRLSHPFFFPLYEEAEKLNLPVCVHASSRRRQRRGRQEHIVRTWWRARLEHGRTGQDSRFDEAASCPDFFLRTRSRIRRRRRGCVRPCGR